MSIKNKWRKFLKIRNVGFILNPFKYMEIFYERNPMKINTVMEPVESKF